MENFMSTGSRSGVHRLLPAAAAAALALILLPGLGGCRDCSGPSEPSPTARPPRPGPAKRAPRPGPKPPEARPASLIELMDGVEPEVRKVTLARVFNASGMAMFGKGKDRRLATVCDLSPGEELPRAWKGGALPAWPPAVTFSSPKDGSYLSGQGKAGAPGSLEAVANVDGEVALLHQTGHRWGINVGGDQIWLGVAEAAKAAGCSNAVTVEGFAPSDEGWEVLMTEESDVRQQRSEENKYKMYRVTFGADGGFQGAVGPITRQDGTVLEEHGGDMVLLPDGHIAIPGFFAGAVYLVSPDGKVTHTEKLDSTRLEGIVWDPEECDLYLVRECAGLGNACVETAPLGVPMWILSYPCPDR